MSKIAGGLTGGEITVGYSIVEDKTTMLNYLQVDVYYNGKELHNKDAFTKEILHDAPVDAIKKQVEMDIMQAVSEIVMDNIGDDTLDKVVDQLKDPSEYINKASISDDDDFWLSEYVSEGNKNLEGQSVVEDLLAVCPGLHEVIEIPKKRFPSKEWPANDKAEVREIVIWMNDILHMSFNEIADWLETLDTDLSIELEGGEQ